MAHLPASATDEELIRFIDGWACLMESEAYAQAFEYTAHHPGWTPELMREAVKTYGKSLPTQKVTVEGQPTDIHQRKEVSRTVRPLNGYMGQIWYDLHIDGYVSDLTATFGIFEAPDGLTICLDDIHVM